MGPDKPILVKGGDIQNYNNNKINNIKQGCLSLTGMKKSITFNFLQNMQRCVSVCGWESTEGHDAHGSFFMFVWTLCGTYPHSQQGISVMQKIRWEERNKASRNESVASSSWLGIHHQTSQIRGNREDINAASKDKWKRRGMRCERRKPLTQSSFDCNEHTFPSTMMYTCTLIDTLHDTPSANQCRWTLPSTLIKSIHFTANCCCTLPHTYRHLKCGLAHVPASLLSIRGWNNMISLILSELKNLLGLSCAFNLSCFQDFIFFAQPQPTRQVGF